MGLFVNLAAAGGFTLQLGAQNWLYYAWMDFLILSGHVAIIHSSSCPLTAW